MTPPTLQNSVASAVKVKLRLALVVCLVLSACGGDSSPTAPDAPPITPPPPPLFAAQGTGNTVIDLPVIVARLRIQGSYTANSSNFIIWCGSQLVVNELLGTAWNQTAYDGTHLIQFRGCPLRIENSTGVAWTLTEVR